MRLVLLLALAAFASSSLASSAAAQGVPIPPSDAPVPPPAQPPPPVARPVPVPAMQPPPLRAPIGPRRLGGPRTGITILSAESARKINEAFGAQTCTGGDYDPTTGNYVEQRCTSEERLPTGFPVVTQFGWQYERRIFQAQSGLTGMTEWVFLLGGAERGLLLPSATFLAGIRAPGGLEVGVGPNLSVSGAAYALTVGMNNEFGEVNLPINVAAVLGQDGPRVSLLVGFNVSESRY